MPRFADFATIYLFYDFIFCFYHYLILRTAQSLRNLFVRRCLPVIIYIAFKVVLIFYFSVYDIWSLDGSNCWLHSGWHFRGYLLKHHFICTNFLIVPTNANCSVYKRCLYRISAGWKANRCRGGFLLHSVSFVNLFTE